jgi:hypothetical protein
MTRKIAIGVCVAAALASGAPGVGRIPADEGRVAGSASRCPSRK